MQSLQQAQELEAENELLGAIIVDLQNKRVPSSSARQTEDALLEMHDECQSAKDALVNEQRELHRTRGLLIDARRAGVLLQQRERMQARNAQATAQALVAELFGVEQESCARKVHMHTLTKQVEKLKEAAAEAVHGMQDTAVPYVACTAAYEF